MSRKKINSLTVHTFGKKENQAIIFVHGFPFDYTMWNDQIRSLQDKYYCVTYDVRGLGDSYVGDGQYTMEFFVDDLFSVIGGLHLNKPVLCSLSMGGYIALRAVEKEQDKFGGLILCDTKPEPDDDKGKLKRAAAINKINTEGLGKFVDDLLPGLFAEETPENMKEMYERILNHSKTYDPVGVKGCLLAMVSRTSTVRFLKKIKIPTLVMGGSFDKLTPPAAMRKTSEKIKGSEFAIVPRAGHMSPVENPSYVNDMIAGFIKRRVVE